MLQAAAEAGRSIRHVQPVDEVEVEPDVLPEVVRIVVEAPRTAAPPAGAVSIEVTVVGAGDGLGIADRGDGRGLGPAARRAEGWYEGRHGRAGMAERSRAIGAALVVDSAPGGGTSLDVRLAAGDPPR